MRVTRIFGLVMAIIMLSSLTAFGMDLPDPMKEYFSVYPESTIIQAMQMPEGATAILECPGTPENVFEYYKKELEKLGWEIKLDMKQSEHWTLGAENDEYTVMFDSGIQDGKTFLSIVISKK